MSQPENWRDSPQLRDVRDEMPADQRADFERLLDALTGVDPYISPPIQLGVGDEALRTFLSLAEQWITLAARGNQDGVVQLALASGILMGRAFA